MAKTIGRVLKINFSKASPPPDIIQQRILEDRIVDALAIKTFDDVLSFSADNKSATCAEIYARTYSKCNGSYHRLEDIAFRSLMAVEARCNARLNDFFSSVNGKSASQINAAEKKILKAVQRDLRHAAVDLAYVAMGVDEPRLKEPSPKI